MADRDPRREAARLGAEAMIDAGKDAARKLYEDLTLSDDEKAKREAERAAAAKRKKWKWIAIGVGALLAFLTVMMLLAKIGPYLLGFAVLAILGFLAWRRIRAATGKKRDDEEKVPEAEEARPVERIAAPREKIRVDDSETIAARAAAATAASAERERKIDEELAELKRKARS